MLDEKTKRALKSVCGIEVKEDTVLSWSLIEQNIPDSDTTDDAQHLRNLCLTMLN